MSRARPPSRTSVSSPQLAPRDVESEAAEADVALDHRVVPIQNN
jgi:hypothetical protein